MAEFGNWTYCKDGLPYGDTYVLAWITDLYSYRHVISFVDFDTNKWECEDEMSAGEKIIKWCYLPNHEEFDVPW